MISLPGDITLHWFDAAVCGFVFLSVLFGFFRGFVREMLALTTWLAAAVLTHYAYDFNATWIKETISDNNLIVTAIAVAAVFVVLVIILSILFSPLWRAVRRSDLWLIDRGLGLFVGLARGVVLVLIIWVGVAIGSQSTTKQEWARDTELVVSVDQNSRKLMGWIADLPHGMLRRDWVQDGIADLVGSMGQELREPSEGPALFVPTPTATGN